MSDLPPPPFVGGSLPPPPFDASLPPPPRQGGGGGLPPPPMDSNNNNNDYNNDYNDDAPPPAHPHPKALGGAKEPANEYQSLPDFSRYEAELDAQKAAPAVVKPTRSLPLPNSPPVNLPPPVADESAGGESGGDEDNFPPPSDPPPASSDSLPPPPIAEPPPFNEDAAPVDAAAATGDQYQVLPRAPGSEGDGLSAAIRNSRGPPPTMSRTSMRRDMPPPAAAGPAASVPATRAGPGQPLPRTSMRGPPSRTPATGSLARGGGGGAPAVMGIGGLPGINAPVPENAPPPPGMPNLPPPVTTPVPNLPAGNGALNLPPIGSLPPPGQLPPPGALPSGLPPAPGSGGPPGGAAGGPPGGAARRMPARTPGGLPGGAASASATNLSVPGSGSDATLGRPPSPGVQASAPTPAPAMPTRGPAVAPRGLPQHQSQPANLRAAAPDGRPAAAAAAAAPADAITPAPLTQHNGEEMYRPAGMGIIKDGSVIKGTAFDKKKNVRWAILYKDRIDMSIQLPQKNQQAMPEVKHVIQLAGCSVELNKKDPKEVVIKDAKGKKFDSFSCDKPEDAEQWVKYIALVVAKLPKAASSKGSGAVKKPAKVFGTDMATLLAWDRQADPTLAVPQIVIECLAYLQNDTVLQTEGLFRLSGSLTKIMEFKALYDAFKPANIGDATDPNVVSGVLKLWLREMPEPLMLYENYDEFIRVAKAGGADELAQYRALCDTLPPDNLNLLRVLMWLCRDVANYEEANKMSPTNLAIVFGPNLLKSQSVDMMTAAEDSQYINDIFKKIILDPEQVVGPRELAVLHSAVADDSAPAAAAAAAGDYNGAMNGGDAPPFQHSASAPAFTDVPGTPQDGGNALRLELQAIEPSNGVCADCSAPDPAFVSLNTGALLCQACSGAHAGTLAIQMNPQGAPLSRPAPIAAAAGDPLIADMLRKCSNLRLNQALEHSVPAGIKPQPNAPDAVRKKFVMAKYAQRAFADHNALQRTQQASLLELLQEGDFARFQAAVLLGANTAALSPEGAPLHEAVRQRDAAAIVLLVLNGADANAVAPAEGANAHQLAQQCGDARIERFLDQHAVAGAGAADNRAAPPEKRPPFGAVNMFGDAPPTLRRGPAVRGPRGPQTGMPAPGRPPPSGPPTRGPDPTPPPSATPPFGGIGIAAGMMNAAAGRRGPTAGPPGPVGGPGAPSQPGGPARRAMPGMGAPGLGGPPGGGGGGGAGGPPPAGARPDRVPPGPMGGVQGGGAAAAAPAAAAAAAASGPVDPNYIDLAGNDLSKCDWFHGKISSADAFKLLTAESKGAFLLRCSSRPGHFVVSWVQENNNIIHTLVSPRPGGGGYDVEGDQRQYNSVPAIMQQYAKHLAKLVLRTGKLV